MEHHARLRKALVTRRGHAAAAAVAAALALTGSQAAGAAAPAWSKKWAEHQLRKHFDASKAVCLPIGSAAKQHGAAVFREFVCVVIARDGTRYTIHLKPTSHTAWKILSIEHRAQGPAAGTGPARGHARRRG
jgi:hypothetical protein